jgi:hypothetical protein
MHGQKTIKLKNIYRLLCGRTVSEKLPKIPLLDLLEFISYGFLDLNNIRKVDSF